MYFDIGFQTVRSNYPTVEERTRVTFRARLTIQKKPLRRIERAYVTVMNEKELVAKFRAGPTAFQYGGGKDVGSKTVGPKK